MLNLGKRIVILGCPGSGKSTLALRLGEITGIPVVHLDKEFWNAGWVETPQDEWRLKLPGLLAGEKWIVEGNYAGTLDIRLKRSDTVIFLDFNRFVCLYSAIKRAIKNHGRTRPDMAQGCPDKADWEFICFIWNFNRKIRPELIAKLRGFGGRIIVKKTRGQVNRFLCGMAYDDMEASTAKIASSGGEDASFRAWRFGGEYIAKKPAISLATKAGILGIVIALLAVTLNVTHLWKNYKYAVLYGNHLSLYSQEQSLFWFDVRHSNNPDDVMFKDIEREFLKFLPDLVLVEGGFNTFEGSRDEAIGVSESAFATYLAKQHGITVEDIEPPFAKQVEYLQTKHLPDEILAMYLIRQLGSIQSMPEKTVFDFDAFMLKETQFITENGLDYNGKDLSDILKTVNKYTPQPVDKSNWREIKAYTIYAKKGGALYPVYNDIYEYRNIYLLELIGEKREYYDKIFVVMGGQHLLDTQVQLKILYPN